MCEMSWTRWLDPVLCSVHVLDLIRLPLLDFPRLSCVSFQVQAADVTHFEAVLVNRLIEEDKRRHRTDLGGDFLPNYSS